MRVVHLLRKPLGEASVAANALTHGTGALHIDAARIGSELRSYCGSGASPQKLNNHGPGDTGVGMLDGRGRGMEFTVVGRWPANLLLEHRAGCRRMGTARLDGEYRDAMTPTTHDAPAKFGYSPDRHQFDYGGEEVETWECGDGCPVADLDLQSGVTTNTAHYSYKRSGGEFINAIADDPERRHWRSETGTASRFFQQLGGKR